MATYYVRSGGSDGNTGLGAGTGQAWATIGKALGATGITGGDMVYIAPGTYREVVTIGGTYASNTFIYGDPTASLFSGVTAGEVRITPSGSDNAVSTSFALTATSKNNLNFRDLIIGGMNITTSSNMTIERCLLFSTSATTQAFVFTNTGNVNYNTTIKQSIITGTVAGIEYKYINFSAPWTAGLYISDCFITGLDAVYLNNNAGFQQYPAGSIVIYNSVLMGYRPWVMPAGFQTVASSGNNIKIYNCVVYATGTYAFQVGLNSGIDENFNRIYGVNTRQNVTQGANTTVASWPGLEFGQSLLQGFGPIQIFGNTFNSPNATAGTASGAPLVDMYNQSWNVTPDVGVAIYRNIGGVGQYLPGERNASAITIAPASTSQSIELYLGATGLTFSTSGLAAYYVRNQSAPVAITLVTQTPTGAWSSGGFAEISSSLVPGVYRLDVPNAAFAAGASDVTIVVRGASGTNGAVLTVTLSSGGLTAAQTAAAVWDASRSAYATAGTFGEYVNVNVNSGAIADAVWDEARSGHTTVGTFGQYVNAELVTPVTSAALVRMGPFEVRADGLGASDPLDLQTGAQHGIDIQCVDNNGSGIDITSATVTAKVYNSGATLVDTYACTATYAANGRATFTIDTTVTNTPGTYTATITRTTGASDTQIFGPLRIYVRDI
jgi:hypothetical protein